MRLWQVPAIEMSSARPWRGRVASGGDIFAKPKAKRLFSPWLKYPPRSVPHVPLARGSEVSQRQPPPIKTPAAKTNAPPSTTWKAARRKGVSMKRFWIQAMAQSSMNTTMIAMVVAVQKSGIR